MNLGLVLNTTNNGSMDVDVYPHSGHIYFIIDEGGTDGDVASVQLTLEEITKLRDFLNSVLTAIQ